MPDPADDAPRGRDEESLFARDENDEIVRRERATRDQFGEAVTVTIDGFRVAVPKAVPATDAQGNVRRAADGQPVPRNSTVYDAAAQLVRDGRWADADLRGRLPVLCHQPHLDPVGVCRMCVVQIQQVKRGEVRTERKLLPACQHPVGDNMVVTTRGAKAADYPPPAPGDEPAHADMLRQVERFVRTIRASTAVLAELLLADHRRPPPPGAAADRYEDELEAVARVAGVAGPRPRLAGRPVDRNALHATAPAARARPIPLPLAPTAVDPDPVDPAGWEAWNAAVDARFPYSSRTVVVDHDRCILCDRCVRACGEVKGFHVIGHTGKGYTARVSFDLDAPMAASSCVQCGECMTSCPTGALSLRRRVRPRAWADSPAAVPQNPNTPFPAGSGFLTADEMRDVWLHFDSPSRGPRVVFPFRSVPYAYLKWNEGAVRRWVLPPGTEKVLCREGEYGSTAFLLQGTGQFDILTRDGRPAAGPADHGRFVRVATGDELVLGEMAALTHRPRTATVVAVVPPDNPRIALGADATGRPTAVLDPAAPGPAVVYEVTRNLLDVMRRTASGRDDLAEMYAFRAVQAGVGSGRVFRGLPAGTQMALTAALLAGGGLEVRAVEAGEVVVAEGAPAADFYLVRYGTLKVYQTAGGRERVVNLLSDGDGFGERARLGPAAGRRTASVAALDRAEVVRVPGEVFRRLFARFPELEAALPAGGGGGPSGGPSPALGEYVQLGLYQGQRVLALDLVSCTRCDECTRACADSHDGHARLLREGPRFGDFLVAVSCRSCRTPYCLDGCPVDAIHRRPDGGLAVVVEDHCIGCGLCERNCPYGSIHMAPRGPARLADRAGPGGEPGESRLVAAPRRAVNCDLCESVGGRPFCVSACPHDAAFRLDGPGLLGWVTERETGRRSGAVGRPVVGR